LDYALITKTAEQANQMLHAVETECRKVGLLINTKKTGDGRKYIEYKYKGSLQSMAQFWKKLMVFNI
jgi:hypothetical protein